jgi:hypothetical protein
MPYLDSKIAIASHRHDCPDPTARRLYIRDYDKKGKQRFVAWGLTCQHCGETWRQPYRHNPTRIQKDKQIEMERMDEGLQSKPESQDEIERKHKEFLIQRKLRRIEYKLKELELDYNPITPHEKTYQGKIKSLNTIYRNDCRCYPILKNIINWDKKLVEKFLNVRPTFDEIHVVLYWSPLYRYNNKKANSRRGWIPHPYKFGSVILDPSHNYIPHPQKPHTWRLNSDPNKMGKFEKLVIEEAKGRMWAMKNIIEKHRKLRGYKKVELIPPSD